MNDPEEYLKKREVEIPEDFLERQRKAVMSKIGERKRISPAYYLLPAFSLGAFLFFFLKGPAPQTTPEEPAVRSEAGFYESLEMLEDLDILEEITEEDLNAL